MPIEGTAYTIRGVSLNACHYPTGEVGPGLKLAELPGRLPNSNQEICWFLYHFRLLEGQCACALSYEARQLEWLM